MSTDTKHTIEDLQTRALDGIRTSQSAVIDGVQAWSERVQRFSSPESTWTRTPTAAETVDAAFSFAGRLLEAQRDFALGLLAATAPRTNDTEHHEG